MSDTANPGSPSGWRDRTAFRESFLVCVSPGSAGTLRQFGRYMFDTLVESGLEDLRSPRIRSEVNAVAEDLRFSAQVLLGLRSADDRFELRSEEAALAIKAESWGREILELVRVIESAVAEPGSAS